MRHITSSTIKLRSADYYPFGMVMTSRTDMTAFAKYKYGYNGKENDNEIKGNCNQEDYGFRIYDPRICRFLSVDPMTREYPELTPYQFASNRPIDGLDLDGLEYSPKRDARFDFWKTEVKIENNRNIINSIGLMVKTEIKGFGYISGAVSEKEWSKYLSKNNDELENAQQDLAYTVRDAIKVGVIGGITYASGGTSNVFFGLNTIRIGLISGGVEGLYQHSTNNFDYLSENFTSIITNGFFKNPVVGGLLGDLGKYTFGLGYSGLGSKKFGLTLDKTLSNSTGNYLGSQWKIGQTMKWNLGKYLDEGMQGMLGNVTSDAINPSTEDTCDDSCVEESKPNKK